MPRQVRFLHDYPSHPCDHPSPQDTCVIRLHDARAAFINGSWVLFVEPFQERLTRGMGTGGGSGRGLGSHRRIGPSCKSVYVGCLPRNMRHQGQQRQPVTVSAQGHDITGTVALVKSIFSFNFSCSHQTTTTCSRNNKISILSLGPAIPCSSETIVIANDDSPLGSAFEMETGIARKTNVRRTMRRLCCCELLNIKNMQNSQNSFSPCRGR